MRIRVRSTEAVMYESEWKRYMKETTGNNFGRLDTETLNRFDSDPVLEGPAATGGTVYQYSQYDGVEQIDGQWFTKYILGPVFQEYTDDDGAVVTVDAQQTAYEAQKDAEQAKSIRETRDTKIAETDWVVVKALESGQSVPTNYSNYRQALRDIPTQSGFPWTVTWPELADA